MTSTKKSLSLADQIAELSNPVPKDFDPEDDRDFDDGSDGQSEDQSGSDAEAQDENAGREHYVAVGKSKLRKNQDLHLDPKYDGAKVNRDALFDSASDSEELSGEGSDQEDEDEDEDMLDDPDSEMEAKTNAHAKSSKAKKVNGFSPRRQSGELSDDDDDEEESDDNEDQSDQEMEDDDDDAEESDEDSDEENARRAQLKKLMIEDQKNAVSNLSKAAKADVDKGLAVRDQRTAFDSFLNSRIKLQKAVIAINSMGPNLEASDSLKEAEDAALSLWNTISNLRQDAINLRNSNNPQVNGTANKKRKHAEITSETSLSEAWSSLQDLERSCTSWRSSTLERWSSKLQASAVPLTKKLNQTAVVQTISSQLHENLQDTDRLVSRTRVPRASAPLQLQKKDVEQDPEIYDDTDFYQVLLKALVDQRMVDNASTGGSNPGMQWTLLDVAELNVKRKKNVDTKASKGRKLRYQVHEKLQNFMTSENNLEWHEQQIDELFSSILGQRLKVDEESSSDGEDEEDKVQESALRLFSSQPNAA